MISDGQHSIRDAVAEVLPGIPRRLCRFHYLREAARPIYEADRHAKVVLKKKVRGIRPIERAIEGRDDEEARAIRAYCVAVRTSLTDDGRPPPAASGLKLRDRLAKVAAGLDEVAAERGAPRSRHGCGRSSPRDWRRPSRPGPRRGRRSAGCTGRRRSSATRGAWTALAFDIDCVGSWGRSRGIASRPAGRLSGAIGHLLKVTRSYWRGLFASYDVADLPRTNTTRSSSSARTAITSGVAAAAR